MSEKPPYHPKATPTITRSVLAPIAVKNDREVETLVPCCWCAPFGGHGMVPVVVRVRWMTAYPELHQADQESVVPGEEP